MRKMSLLLGLSLAGCAPKFIPPIVPTPRHARSVAAPVDTVWNAVIDYFAREVIPIETLDRSSGLIVASRGLIPTRTKQDSASAAQLADCGRFPKDFNNIVERVVVPTSAKYNVLVRAAGPSESTLLVTAKFLGRLNLEPVDCTSKGFFEETVEAAVATAATKRK
jgi:hypothetical protein